MLLRTAHPCYRPASAQMILLPLTLTSRRRQWRPAVTWSMPARPISSVPAHFESSLPPAHLCGRIFGCLHRAISHRKACSPQITRPDSATPVFAGWSRGADSKEETNCDRTDQVCWLAGYSGATECVFPGCAGAEGKAHADTQAHLYVHEGNAHPCARGQCYACSCGHRCRLSCGYAFCCGNERSLSHGSGNRYAFSCVLGSAHGCTFCYG
jgi:hypothetical protein